LGKKRMLLAYPREFVDNSYGKLLVDRLREAAEIEVKTPRTQGEWKAALKGVTVLVSGRVSSDVLQVAEDLEMVQTFSIGYDRIDVLAATERGVIVCNVGEVMAESVAQHNWALILALSKHVCSSDRRLRRGIWRDGPRFGVQLWGKTLGVIGLGAIGSRVALKGHLAFNMTVLAYDPYVLDEKAALFNARKVDLSTLLRTSDVISVNCPLTRETRHLLGPNEFELMKRTALLVNTSRGAVIDQRALTTCLQEGTIAGAGLDVFESEPIEPESPITKLENVILTPHIASSTPEAFTRTWARGSENIKAFLDGGKPNWIVNPAAWALRNR
jgi:lactate dehydrogenase-like 2-hydroxyacid dehydrogenase